MIRAVIYARVSSAAQRDAHTIENQLLVLRAFIAAQGWDLVGTYIDDGRSAKTGKLELRDGFARLLRDAGAGAFDVLVVVDVDRLTRTSDMTERAAILGPFQRAGVRIVTPTGGELDLRTMLGELYVTMQALVAAEENRKRAERVKAGKLRAIAEGRKPSGPTPYGLAYDRASSRWSLDEPRAAVYREIFARVIAGESCAAIAEDLYARAAVSPRGPWERHKVWALVRSRHAVGEWLADKARKLVVPVPPIVDEATWQAAQDKLVQHGKRGLRRTRHVYLLEGLAVCSRCGSPIAIRSANPRAGYAAQYVCRARKLHRIGDPRCSAPILPVADVDARVWASITAAIAAPELLGELAQLSERRSADRGSWQHDVDVHTQHLERLAKVEASHLARYRRGLVSDEALEAELAALRRERAALQRQLATAARAVQAHAGDVEMPPARWLAALRALVKKDAPEVHQRLVRALVSPGGAVVLDDRVQLTLDVEEAAASLGGLVGDASVAGLGCSTPPRGMYRISLVA